MKCGLNKKEAPRKFRGASFLCLPVFVIRLCFVIRLFAWLVFRAVGRGSFGVFARESV